MQGSLRVAGIKGITGNYGEGVGQIKLAIDIIRVICGADKETAMNKGGMVDEKKSNCTEYKDEDKEDDLTYDDI